MLKNGKLQVKGNVRAENAFLIGRDEIIDVLFLLKSAILMKDLVGFLVAVFLFVINHRPVFELKG